MLDFLPCTIDNYNKSIEKYGELLEILGNDEKILKTARKYMGKKHMIYR